MDRKSLWLAILITLAGACDSREQGINDELSRNTSDKLNNPGLSARIDQLLNYPDDSGFPRSLEPSGEIREVASRDWTSGFYPGILWFAWEYTGREAFRTKAELWTEKVEPEKFNAGTHDMGFKINCSFGNGYRITGNEAYREVILTAAKTLSTRFNDVVGCTRSWDFNKEEWKFPVIIDNMMNLELLFLATQLSGDSTYYRMAYRHAMTTMQHHFREDNSSWHVVDYDPETGEVISKETHQGFSDGSAWARGQAWGLYGFTMAYRFTGEAKFLEQAEKIYQYIFNYRQLPEDLIPFWDFDAPDSAGNPRDASAAAITASALYELGALTENETMVANADEILEVLTEKYLVPARQDHIFILTHSTGNMPREDEVDVPIIYADYYFLEALLRKEQIKEK